MIPTKQQQNFYDIISGARKVPGDWSGNISIQAVAGSGKTTTAVAGAKHASKRYKRIGFTAFNKSIADELGKRLVGSAQASTLHSLGNRLIRQKFNFVSLEQDKYRKIAKSEFPSYFQSKAGSSKGYFLKPEYASLFALIEMIRVQNIPVDYLSAELMERVQVCADKTGISLPSKEFVQEVVGAAFRCLEIGSDPALLPSHGIDFSDMIWLPVRLDLGSNIFDLLLADEAQDFNRVQQDLVCRVSQNTVIVGDEFQAIQGWAGADCQSFPNMTKRLKARKMPLSVCWRCPSSHLDLARFLVPHIEVSPTAQRGEIDEFDSYQVPRVVTPGDLIICRNNAPLIGAAYNMMRSKVPCLVRGKDIGASMLQLVEKLDPMDIKDLHHRLQRWQEKEIKKLFDRDAHETAYQLVNDQVECIRELAQDCDNIGEFTEICKTLFTDTDETGKVILSSVHRAKGLEADRVVLLKPELMCTRASDQEAYQQEKNLLYVALTRAKSRLTFADGPGSCRPDLHSWVSEIASSDMPIRRRV